MSRINRLQTATHAVCGIFLLLAGAAGPATAQERQDTLTFRGDTIHVQFSRLRAGGVPLNRLPFSIQVVESVEQEPVGTVADLLARVVGISEASQFGSPHQPDLRLRGFQVGPVVGQPQSVSVFVDGVRVNEPDASQVNFDLIPLEAVERIEVIRTPGGPFGRNTLAGAINIVTRRGEGPAEGQVGLAGGSFGTVQASGWAGGSVEETPFDYLLAARYSESEGWREKSASRIGRLFMKAGYTGARTDGWLSYTFVDNRVEGPGSLPRSWLRGQLPAELEGVEDPRRLQFTGFQGDWFQPRLHFVSGEAARDVGNSGSLQVSGFLRSNRFTQYNDNITEANVRGETDILSTGAALQYAQEFDGGARLAGGLEYVVNDTDIGIWAEPNAAFPEAGGRTEDVGSRDRNAGLFLNGWLPLGTRLSATAALRYDRVVIPFDDRLDPDNSGDNIFGQLSGSLGLDAVLAPGARAFASYGRGFRAPVILELACADPEDPCPLPFELGADPPLEPVTTDTWQAGLEVGSSFGAALSVVGYWAEVHDDLFAVIVPPSTRGYFDNLDRTRRRGLEVDGVLPVAPDLEARASAAFTEATFQSRATLSGGVGEEESEEGPAEPEEEAGELVQVEPGDRFAMSPLFTGGASLAWTPGAWRVELMGTAVGRQYFVGDEDNTAEEGALPAYAVLDAVVERRFGPVLATLAASNILDSDHSTYGVLSPNVRGPVEERQPFLSPAQPFRLYVGLRYGF